MTAASIVFLRAWVGTRCRRDERGANLVEYILLVSVIAIFVIGAMAFFGSCMKTAYQHTGSTIEGT